MNRIFTFSETKVSGAGFESMGVDSKRLILYLNSIFIYFVCFTAIIFLYGILQPLRGYGFIDRLCIKIKNNFIWSGYLGLITQSYLNLCTGCLLSYSEINFTTHSDIFDFVFTILMSVAVIGYPLLVYFLLSTDLDNSIN